MVHIYYCTWYSRRPSFGRQPEQTTCDRESLVWIPTVSRLLQQGRHGRPDAAATGLKRAAPLRHLRSTCESYNVDDPICATTVVARTCSSTRKCERLLFLCCVLRVKRIKCLKNEVTSLSRPLGHNARRRRRNPRSAQHRPMKGLFLCLSAILLNN